MSGWSGFDTNVTAFRQKNSYIHGFLDISGVIKSPSILASYNVVTTTPSLNGTVFVNNLISTGSVGIGTTSPKVPLHVFSNVSVSNPQTYYYVDTTNTKITSATNKTWTDVCVFATGSMMATDTFVASSNATFSDKRIKKNIMPMNKETLENFRKIQPKIYEYIDVVSKGNYSNYGFIAQEVEEVLPFAVQYQTLYIPNVYDKADVSGNLITLSSKTTDDFEYDASHNLFTKLKLYDSENNEIETTIVSIVNKTTFVISEHLDIKHTFVYGQEVNNYRALNYDVLFMLSYYAYQELDKEVMELKTKNNSLEMKIQNIKTKLSIL